MFNSARKSMPTLDYVSIIRSVYGDRQALLAAALGTALAAGLSAYKSQSLPLLVTAMAFIVIGVLRYLDSRAFWHAAIENDDAEGAQHWENRAIVSGGALAIVYGSWCFISMVLVKDPFAELASATLTTAAMVGVVARNFGLDRLVTIQLVIATVPLSLGYAWHGDLYHFVLAALLGVMLASLRKLAGDIRSILLSAVHERVQASRLAAELDMAISTMQHGLFMLDERGIITVANEHVQHIFAQFEANSLIGQNLAQLLTTLDKTGYLPHSAVDRLIAMVDIRAAGKVLVSLQTGQYFEVTVSFRLDRSVLLFEDVSERISADERITFMARHDTLTGLPNRAYFGETVADDLQNRDREAGAPRTIALMILDIDDFKHVNDTFGHMVGDRLLGEIARRLTENVRPDATLARLGGDEFIIYCGQTSDQEAAKTDVEAVVAAFQTPFTVDGMALMINVSVGLVTSTAASENFDALMTKADLALYRAKADGKGRSEVFHAQMDTDYHYRQRLKTDLGRAVRNGSLSLVFQPQIDIVSRKVVTCEALARWDHPELGSIAPSTFIPLAEEVGLISDITAWVLKEATAQCLMWPDNIGVAVNISARDFRSGDIGVMVARALDRSGLPACRLEVEVTETALIEENNIAYDVLKALANQGISIALDDFGTGYSSLSYLNTLPFTKLKIDRSFVIDIATSSRALKLLANVARLGHDLGMRVTAEGVETRDQLNAMLAKTQIDEVQGYFFSRPLPSHDIAELIDRLNAAARSTQSIRKHG